ncbi:MULTISPECIES: thymidylate synthase [Serratia]|uniref:Thymidylate synthase n=2 Tax=Serratia TaxID=613 RepID=A0A2F0PGD2_SERMA|nr:MULTISPECIES: thymidylate synthase [Serratia]AUY17103.1 thymidylate synthase [Serratia sp. SSNIH1]OCO74956.1 thymidylate synthase [Serratia marcescens]OCO83149.1 thymidylate synthase [Serratia marcescens]POU56610.1 thymidylate synthase [Serratia sp. SSNIH4]POW42914.1 thymidylate synthase [Serratia sp. SSNIH2]
MHVVYGETINDITIKILEKVLKEGVSISTRNGNAVTIYDVSMILHNPRSRHLSLKGRKNNIFSTFAEAMWVLAGDNRINPYLNFFLPRAPKYSDDGVIWRAAYGERLYAHGQLENVVQQFKKEGIFTRRAVISLYMPDRDTHDSLINVYNLEDSLDIPCNNLIHFFITPDKKLNIKITQRSGDLIFGVSNINIFEFSLLQEVVLFILQREVDNQIELGYLHQSVTNLHIYEDRMAQANEIYKRKEKQKTGLINDDNISFPTSLAGIKLLFCDIVSFLERIIIDIPNKIDTMDKENEKLKDIFRKHIVETEDNLLWGYAEAALSYVFQERFNERIVLTTKLSNEFNLSITSNHFNNSNKEWL